jgi:hypothetical protein
VHWRFGACACGGGAYHCEGDVLDLLSVESVSWYSFKSKCSGLVYELSGESRFRSMVRESSMELKPRCLSKGGGRVLRLAPLPIRVWGRCFSQKSAEVEALLQELL